MVNQHQHISTTNSEVSEWLSDKAKEDKNFLIQTRDSIKQRFWDKPEAANILINKLYDIGKILKKFYGERWDDKQQNKINW